MPTVTITPIAERNLKAIALYIASDSPERAHTFIYALQSHCLELETFPKQGVAAPTLGPGIRRLVYGNYTIFYRYIEDKDAVHILRISEQHQDFSRIVFED